MVGGDQLVAAQGSCDDDAVGRGGMKIHQTVGTDSYLAIDGNLDQAVIQERMSARMRIGPFSCNKASSQNVIAKTAASPPCTARSRRFRALLPSLASPSRLQTSTCVSSKSIPCRR